MHDPMSQGRESREGGRPPCELDEHRILRLNVAGAPIEWIDWRQAVTLQSRGLVVWTLGEVVAEVRGGTDRRGQRSVAELFGILACRGQLRELAHCTPAIDNRALFSRDDHLCLYCGERFAATGLTRDHVVPLARGGRNLWTNLATACRRCNQRKGSRTPEQADMPLLAVPYKPNRAEYLALINRRRIRGDQMDFLRAHFSRNWQTTRIH